MTPCFAPGSLAFFGPHSPSPFERCVSRRTSPRPGVTFRPQVEVLDTRDVPITLTWTNALGTGVATAAGNWRLDSGQSSTRPPQQGDTLVFDGTVSIASCTGL